MSSLERCRGSNFFRVESMGKGQWFALGPGLIQKTLTRFENLASELSRCPYMCSRPGP